MSASREVVVGLEAGGTDAGDGAQVVDLVGVAGGADRADHLAVLVADQLAAALQEHRPVRQLQERFA